MDKDSKGDIEKELDEITFRAYALYVGNKLLAHGLDFNKLTNIAADMAVKSSYSFCRKRR